MNHHLLRIFAYIIAATIVTQTNACSPCTHPGTFAGFLTAYTPANPNYCQTQVGGNTVAVSVPYKFFNPPDESPCDATVNITNTCTGKTISALIVGNCTTCANNDILLTTPGLAALAPNGKAAGAPQIVVWTFND